MKTTLNEKIIAYLALISGLAVSAVAVYYSVSGLASIFAAAVTPIVIMGVALEISKIVATVWLKQNWNSAHWTLKIYLSLAVALLMVITSMGIFGFLSKAHSDQNLVSGEITAKIAVYDEQIKVEKENIDVNRTAIQQMDQGIEQIMARSTTEGGAEKAVAIRKSQQKERQRLLGEIAASQQKIASLSNERAPIAGEVRKVEAEVGPIKYIAAFFYGNTDPSILERAVTWVILIIIVVFDPLALILLIASQASFQKFREREAEPEEDILSSKEFFPHTDTTNPPAEEFFEEDFEEPVYDVDDGTFLTPHQTNTDNPVDFPKAETVASAPVPIVSREESRVVRTKVFPRASVTVPLPETYVQNEEQSESNTWSNVTNAITQEEYMTQSHTKQTKAD
jgi:hypothetical protein